MRCLVLIALLALTGCSTLQGWLSPDGDKRPPPTPVPSPGSLGTLGNNIDKSDSKVASAVTVMVESSDKPAVVQAEGRVALAGLPKPTAADLQQARLRASTYDQNAYDSEIVKSAVRLREVELEWNEALVQSQKNASELTQSRKELVSAAKQISELKSKLDESDRQLWTMAGVALFVGGVLSGAIFGWRIGGSILACAPLAAAVPVIVNSEYFSYIVGATGLACASLLIWWLFDKVRDAVVKPNKR